MQVISNDRNEYQLLYEDNKIKLKKNFTKIINIHDLNILGLIPFSNKQEKIMKMMCNFNKLKNSIRKFYLIISLYKRTYSYI